MPPYVARLMTVQGQLRHTADDIYNMSCKGILASLIAADYLEDAQAEAHRNIPPPKKPR